MKTEIYFFRHESPESHLYSLYLITVFYRFFKSIHYANSLLGKTYIREDLYQYLFPLIKRNSKKISILKKRVKNKNSNQHLFCSEPL